jgi:hypothetical protein
VLVHEMQMKTLDLAEEAIRHRVRGVTLPAELRRLFDKDGCDLLA